MPFVKKQDMGSKVGQAFGAALSAAGKAVPDAIDWMKKQEETKLRLEGLAQQKELMETSIKMQKEQAYQMGDALETQAVFAIGTAVDDNGACVGIVGRVTEGTVAFPKRATLVSTLYKDFLGGDLG